MSIAEYRLCGVALSQIFAVTIGRHECRFVSAGTGPALQTGGGEISWKSAILLAQMKHPRCLSYYEQGAKLQGLFFLSRIECLKGLVNERGAEYMQLYQELLNDPQEEIRDAAKDVMNRLNREEHEG